MAGVPAVEATRAWLRSVRPRRSELKNDALAGLPGAISSVPDGMAASVLAGVNPVHGLYACYVGPIAGGLSSSTRLMVVTTTSAASLAAGSALAHTPAANRSDAIIWLTLIAGGLMVAAGIARLGRYTRFVSQSVMLGFLSGVSINIVLGQIPDLTGAPSKGPFALAKAYNVLTHPSTIQLASLAAGLGALAILILLAHTRLRLVSSLIALVIPTVLVLWIGADAVAQVSDEGAIPTGLPLPVVPHLGALSWSVMSGALAVAAIVLVQGAGVAESAPNPDGSRANQNQNFIAQGAGNLASGLFGGQPVGGSVGQTAINVTAGARSRWGGIWSGIWMLLILVVFSKLVSQVVTPTLAAVLIFAGVASLKPHEVVTVFRTGHNAQIGMVTTFLSTLVLPVAAAVGIGVALSLLLQLNQEALDLSVKRLVPAPEGGFIETQSPKSLVGIDVLVLDVYGSLFYAGARTLQAHLPDPAGATAPTVVLRIRGRTTLGSTFFTVIGGYADQLAAVDGVLSLTGVDPHVAAQWEALGLPGHHDNVHLFVAEPKVGASTLEALDEARRRQDLEDLSSDDSPDDPSSDLPRP